MRNTGYEYEIIAIYANGEVEVVDAADTKEEAEYLAGEYQVAFGPTITIDLRLVDNYEE